MPDTSASPDQLGPQEIRQYQLHLLESGVQYGSLQQAVSALRFFYGVTLGKRWVIEKIPYPKAERRLPDIPTQEEVVRFLKASHVRAQARFPGQLTGTLYCASTDQSVTHPSREQPDAGPRRYRPRR